ncbi:MAG: Imm10 family immunity protein [Bacillota bacterium]|nr:Imm10 family immunity protein [Bacillota bacterium]
MKTILSAKYIDMSIEEDLNLLCIAFVDNKRNEYISLQQTINADECDINLGMGEVYIEHNDQLYASYGGIKKVTLKNSCIDLILDVTIADQILMGEHVQIMLPEEYSNIIELKDYLELIFKHDLDVFVS